MPPLVPTLRWPLVALLLCAGIAPAAAQDDAFSDAPPRRLRVVRRAPHPIGPPPAVFSGYMPRNPAVPMYNEPPGLRALGYDRR